MRSVRLGSVLVILNVGLLLVAVGLVAWAAVGLLRQLADHQAMARVEHSGVSARHAIERSGEEVVTQAHVLAGRPSLPRLQDRPALADYLDRYRQASHLDGIVLVRDGQVAAASGEAMDWAAARREHGREAGYFFHRLAGGALALGAWADSPVESGTAVGVMVRVDEGFVRAIAEEIGLPVRVLAPGQAPATGRYVSLVPLGTPGGGTVALIETVLSPGEIDRSVRAFAGNLLGLTAAVAALAALASFLLGSRLGRPLEALTGAASRIGRGDLLTPIPSMGGAEIAALAGALDEMRRSLLRLTSDLRRQQAESEAVVTGIVEGVFSVDRERRLQYLNPQAASLLGVAAEEALGRFCGDVLNPQGEGGVRPCEARCPILHARFRAGARAAEHLVLADGRRRTVVITSAPPVEDAGLLRQMQVMRDETEVESARRARDTVLATISHEFKTPLSAQLASIELLLDELPRLTPEQVGDLVLSLQRGTLRLTQLIDNLLESVRLEAGQFTLRRRTVSVDEVVEQALEQTRPLLEQRGQEAVVDLPYPVPALSGDSARLTQVLVNLLANANKFAPPDTQIRLGGAAGPDTFTLWVEDEGPGLPLPPEQALFAPFVRSADPEGEPEASGVGLGLWIVKSIVERHGGRVEARGSRVSVILPTGASDEDTGG